MKFFYLKNYFDQFFLNMSEKFEKQNSLQNRGEHAILKCQWKAWKTEFIAKSRWKCNCLVTAVLRNVMELRTQVNGTRWT